MAILLFLKKEGFGNPKINILTETVSKVKIIAEIVTPNLFRGLTCRVLGS